MFLASVASGKLEMGLLLVMIFSLGLAAALVAIGIIFLKASSLLSSMELEGHWGDRISWASAIIITAVGLIYFAKYTEPLYG